MAWRVAQCLLTLRDQVDARWPGRNKASDGTIGDAAHQATASDHNPGADGVVEAIDLTHDPAAGFDSTVFAETLRAARDPRLEYVISNRRIFFSGGAKPWQWQGYNGANAHDHHVHVSCRPEPDIYDNPGPWVIERAAAKPGVHTDIVATVFGGPADAMSGAVTAYGALVAPEWWDRPGVALPARLSDRPLPKVRITSKRDGRSIVAPVIDVGPWNTADAYWRTPGGRPQAETGTDTRGRRTNLAGIDLTPAAAAAIGLTGKGLVDWEFIEETTMTETQSPSTPSNAPATAGLDLDALNKAIAASIAQAIATQITAQLLRGGPLAIPALPAPAAPAEPANPVPPVPPTPNAPPATAALSVLTKPGTQLGTILGIAVIALQLFGILPPGLGETATAAGQGLSFLAGVAPVAGATGLFGTLGQLMRRMLGPAS